MSSKHGGSLPTVVGLCVALGPALQPVDGFTPTDDEVRAVHISELPDPTTYLSGGELLLTTGLALPREVTACREYVQRLVSAGVSALAIGLGPVHDAPPPALIDACKTAKLCLLQVPGPTPFLEITGAFWAAVRRSSERGLTDAITAQRHLVAAATSTDPVEAITRVVARVLGGWAALLEPDGSVRELAPSSQRPAVDQVGQELVRLGFTDVINSSASFPIGDDMVVVFPLAVEEGVVGHVAVGRRGGIEQGHRHVVLTACALLTLDAVRRREAEAAEAAAGRPVAILASLGEPDLARRLADRLDIGLRDRPVRVIRVRSTRQLDLHRALRRWAPDTLSVQDGKGRAWHLVPHDGQMIDDLAPLVLSVDASAIAVVSDAVDLREVPRALKELERREAGLSPGTIIVPSVLTSPIEDDRLCAGLEALRSSSRSSELVDALGAYLRHGGRWEDASRTHGVHRNTLRHRIARCRAILDLDLDDPDVRATLWLVMRRRGDA